MTALIAAAETESREQEVDKKVNWKRQHFRISNEKLNKLSNTHLYNVHGMFSQLKYTNAYTHDKINDNNWVKQCC